MESQGQQDEVRTVFPYCQYKGSYEQREHLLDNFLVELDEDLNIQAVKSDQTSLPEGTSQLLFESAMVYNVTVTFLKTSGGTKEDKTKQKMELIQLEEQYRKWTGWGLVGGDFMYIMQTAEYAVVNGKVISSLKHLFRERRLPKGYRYNREDDSESFDDASNGFSADSPHATPGQSTTPASASISPTTAMERRSDGYTTLGEIAKTWMNEMGYET